MDSEKSIALEWFLYAENDYEVAVLLSKQVKPKLEIACYHCQQCIEKYLKGFIASKGGMLQKTHSLVVLCNVCISYDERFNNILEMCANLTVYGSEVRYPNKSEIDVSHMNKALEETSKIIEFVKVVTKKLLNLKKWRLLTISEGILN